MNRRRNSNNESRGRALDLWQAPAGAGEPLVCVATTFTFDATFFETECLGRFLQMDSHPQESESVGYLIEREEKLASARVCVLVDRQHATAKESLRWDVLPVAVRGAIQHAKLAVLCWANHVRLIVGSGNLTEPGYRKNLEVFGAVDVSRDEGGPIGLLSGALEFLEGVLVHAVGDEALGPRRRAAEMVSAVARHTAEWPADSAPNRVVPIFCGMGASLFEQLRTAWPSGSPPRRASVLSPFFDGGEQAREAVAGLVGTMAQRRPREIEFLVAGDERADGRLELAVPREVVEHAQESADVYVWRVPTEQDEDLRPLHAKMISLANHDWQLVVIGSSNFTRAGQGVRGKGRANFEANLAYLTRSGEAEHRQLEAVWPEVDPDPVDLESDRVAWLTRTEAEGEEANTVPLPTAFKEALFDSSAAARLLLHFGAGLPAWWEIRDDRQQLLLASHDWNGAAGHHELAWANRAPPFELAVSWKSPEGDVQAASWPVNALDPASLPPPGILATLTLEELIEVLSSTRPLHVAIVQAIRKRAPRGGDQEVALDPHKRVNTETFLLRRTKRVALALERLRQRLERPVLSKDAFEWRLRGPVGPVALCEAFKKDSRSDAEAAFFLAELALTLKRVRVDHAASGGLSRSTIRQCLRDCIRQAEASLGSLELPPGGAMDRYVGAAIKEANQ